MTYFTAKSMDRSLASESKDVTADPIADYTTKISANQTKSKLLVAL